MKCTPTPWLIWQIVRAYYSNDLSRALSVPALKKLPLHNSSVYIIASTTFMYIQALLVPRVRCLMYPDASCFFCQTTHFPKSGKLNRGQLSLKLPLIKSFGGLFYEIESNIWAGLGCFGRLEFMNVK